MLDIKEIELEIAELEYAKDHTPKMCARLADLYSLRDHLKQDEPMTIQSFSLASEPKPIGQYGDSEFLLAISDKEPEEVWRIIDTLMDTLRVVNERVYNSVMMKINNL